MKYKLPTYITKEPYFCMVVGGSLQHSGPPDRAVSDVYICFQSLWCSRKVKTLKNWMQVAQLCKHPSLTQSCSSPVLRAECISRENVVNVVPIKRTKRNHSSDRNL